MLALLFFIKLFNWLSFFLGVIITTTLILSSIYTYIETYFFLKVPFILNATNLEKLILYLLFFFTIFNFPDFLSAEVDPNSFKDVDKDLSPLMEKQVEVSNKDGSKNYVLLIGGVIILCVMYFFGK